MKEFENGDDVIFTTKDKYIFEAKIEKIYRSSFYISYLNEDGKLKYATVFEKQIKFNYKKHRNNRLKELGI